MLAVAGHIWTTAGNRLPGDIDYSGTSFASIKVGLAGISDIPQAGLVQIIAFIGFLELFVMKDRTGDGEFPGDFRNGGDYGWGKLSDEVKMEKRAIELNNGRAAQMGILGLMVHEQVRIQATYFLCFFKNSPWLYPLAYGRTIRNQLASRLSHCLRQEYTISWWKFAKLISSWKRCCKLAKVMQHFLGFLK